MTKKLSIDLSGNDDDNNNKTYKQILNGLMEIDQNKYERNGIVGLLQKNQAVKTCPQYFFDNNDKFEIVFTTSTAIFDVVCGEISRRSLKTSSPSQTVHVININVPDTIRDARENAIYFLKIARFIRDSDDYENELGEFLSEYELKIRKEIDHVVFVY